MNVTATVDGLRVVIGDAAEIHVHVRRVDAVAECWWAGEITERQLRQLRTALLSHGFVSARLTGDMRL